MKGKMVVAVLLCVSLLFALTLTSSGDTVSALSETASKETLSLSSRSAVLIEASTGTVLYENNASEPLPPASVTKVMTLLLLMEALEEGRFSTEDIVTASEHASSMGGTQIYLETGETMTVDDLIKAIAIPSANDATVAMAEFCCGTEEAFVAKMNERASALGMKNTHFTSATGLFDDDTHVTTAYDMALCARELCKHKAIFNYTTVWMDSLRDGAFGLATTNKMLKSYSGMTGMKTGYTHAAGHCFVGTAERDGMTLISVVLGGISSEERFGDTRKLLDYGFANYAVVTKTPEVPSTVAAVKGESDRVPVSVRGSVDLLVNKGEEGLVQTVVSLPAYVTAPVQKGDVVGQVRLELNGNVLRTFDIVADEDVKRAGFFDYFRWFIDQLVFG